LRSDPGRSNILPWCRNVLISQMRRAAVSCRLHG
jgi:hypothetical protein